jgi:hypothetical protein
MTEARPRATYRTDFSQTAVNFQLLQQVCIACASVKHTTGKTEAEAGSPRSLQVGQALASPGRATPAQVTRRERMKKFIFAAVAALPIAAAAVALAPVVHADTP